MSQWFPFTRSIRLMERMILIGAVLGGAHLSAETAGEEVFFAFDDRSIPWRHNLKLSLVEAEKHPKNPVLRRGPNG